MKVRLWNKGQNPIDLEVDRVEVDHDEVTLHGIEDKDKDRNCTDLVLKYNKYSGKWKVWYAHMDDALSMPLSFSNLDVIARRRRRSG